MGYFGRVVGPIEGVSDEVLGNTREVVWICRLAYFLCVDLIKQIVHFSLIEEDVISCGRSEPNVDHVLSLVILVRVELEEAEQNFSCCGVRILEPLVILVPVYVGFCCEELGFHDLLRRVLVLVVVDVDLCLCFLRSAPLQINHHPSVQHEGEQEEVDGEGVEAIVLVTWQSTVPGF